MLRCNDYIFAESLEEAYELNQKKNNVIVAGNGWLKLRKRQWGTVIDISRLCLDKITENDEEFRIGAMVCLSDIENHKELNDYTDGAVKESLRHIVGTQFRNCVTLGGSIFGRFGFSDVLSMFIVMDSYVELYKGGIVPMHEFAKMPYDDDILVSIIVKKKPLRLAYSSFRNQSTDFPVVTCAVAIGEDIITTAIGARPAKADIRTDGIDACRDLKDYAKKTAESFDYESNMRASAEYRRHIAEVLIKRTVEKIEVRYGNQIMDK